MIHVQVACRLEPGDRERLSGGGELSVDHQPRRSVCFQRRVGRGAKSHRMAAKPGVKGGCVNLRAGGNRCWQHRIAEGGLPRFFADRYNDHRLSGDSGHFADESVDGRGIEEVGQAAADDGIDGLVGERE